MRIWLRVLLTGITVLTWLAGAVALAVLLVVFGGGA